MKRKTYHHGDLKATLFKSCHKLLKKFDPSEISLRIVADLAGVSHSAIYRHFKDKDELLEVMAAYGFDRLARAQNKAFEKEKNYEAGLIQLGLAYIQFATSNPHYYKIMFLTKRNNPSHNLRRSQLRSYSVLVSSCKLFLKEKMNATEPRVYALMCWSLVHGYSNLCIETEFPKSEASSLKKSYPHFAEEVLRNAIN
ncbi:MAG: TetR/AcrR family transcriptional regulator [Leptospira sp.]|nr:TetR/AcrR family transcriptional regulator [Leptospira sp.]